LIKHLEEAQMKQNILKLLLAMLCGLLFVGCVATKQSPEQQAVQAAKDAVMKADQAAIEEVIAQYAQTIRENAPEAMFAMCTDDAMLFMPSKGKAISMKEAKAGGLLNDDFKMLSAPGCKYTINDFKNWRFKEDEALVNMQKASNCPGSGGKSKPSTMGFRKVEGDKKLFFWLEL
jgi:ketosteroid isomerase-like protein